MRNKLKHFLLTILFPLWGLGGFAQTYPVTIYSHLSYPTPIYLSNYANTATINSPLRVQLTLNDLTIMNRQIRLKFYLQGRLTLVSRDYIIGAQPIYLQGGVPTELTNVELGAYFELRNLQGINPNQYGQPIPEGMYDFCVEVYDFITNKRLSNKTCVSAVIFQNDPPFLNLPVNNEKIMQQDIQNIVFSWTPRNINVSNVEYEFSLVELWNPNIPYQTAFDYAPPLYTETIRTTTLQYDMMKPQLIPGKNYAWRVKAKAMQGAEEIGMFKNNGFSEVFTFKYLTNCRAPISVTTTGVSQDQAKVTWIGDIANWDYQVSYREKNARSKWYTIITPRQYATITNLKPNTAYEYTVGAACDLGEYTLSGIQEFTTLAKDEIAFAGCGIKPDPADLANQTPLPALFTNDVVMAGDFPIVVLHATGSNGTFSGDGFVTFPFIEKFKQKIGGAIDANSKSNVGIKITFNNIGVNTDFKLISGEIVASYDKDWGNLVDVSSILESAEVLTDQIKTGVEELIQKGTITKDEGDNIIKEAEAEHEKIIKSGEEIKEVHQQISKEKEENKEKQEPTEEQQKKIETAKASMKDAQKSLKDIADKYGAKAGKGNRESDGYFQGLLPLAANNGTVQVKQIDGKGSFTFKTTDESNLKTYSTIISGKTYTVVITTSNSTKEELEKAKSLVDNPTGGIVIYNHYDLKNSKLGYKVNFGSDYYNNPKQYSPEAINALFVYALNDKLDEAKSVTDWGSEIFKITSQIDAVFQEVINKIESTLFTKEGLQHFQETIAFMKKCKSDYALQQEGYIPRCLWDHNQNVPYVTDMAFSAGFTDGLIETVVGVFQMTKFVSCWDITNLNSFFSSDCVEIRDKTQKVLQLAYTTFSDYDKFSTATSGAWSSIKEYTDETTKLDNQARYNQGKIVFNVASLFIGAGEAKAILKGETTLATVLKESMLAYKNLPKSISKLVLNSSKNVKAVLQKTGAEFYLFYKLNTSELKFGSVLNGTFKADNWITVGNKLETIENCAYLGKDGKIVTGTIEVVEKDGVVGVRVNNDLPSIIRQLTTKPTYKPLRTIFSKSDKTTTFIGKWQDELSLLYKELSETTDLNIYMNSGKFENKGGFNMLSIENWGEEVVEKATKKGIKPNTKAFDDFIWDVYNKPWLESAMQRGDEIIIWSDPTSKVNLTKEFKIEGIWDKTFFGREIEFIQNNASKYGYDYYKGIDLGTFSK